MYLLRNRPKSFDEKIPLKRLLLKTVIAIFTLALLFNLTQTQIQNIIQSREIKHTTLGTDNQNESQGLPVRLKIPAINLSATIQHVGINSEGEMESPSNTTDVGWFKFGRLPGEMGSAVIAGHFDGKNDDAGVFANLYKLKPGDKLYVEYDKGSPVTFVVREIQTYNPGYVLDVFNRNDTSHLNLVTCDGVWNGFEKSYSKRLVVFTDITS